MKRFIAIIAALLIPLNLAVAQQVSGGGSGGTPGGSTTQVQYNNAGVFAGDSVFTFNNSTKALTIANASDNISGGTLQGSWPTAGGTSRAFQFAPGGDAHVFVGAGSIALHGGVVIGWANGVGNNPLFDAPDTTIARNAANVLEVNNGTKGTLTGTYIKWGGQSRVSTQFDKTSSTTLGDVTGLTATVAAGRTYSFQAVLYCTCAAAGGAKVAVAGTATATAIRYRAKTFTGATINTHDQATALGSAVGASTTAVTVIEMDGTITVNAAGTLTIQFAENAASGTSSVLVGSFFIVQDMT